MIERKDLWRHVFNAQMIKRGVLDELEALSRNEENEELEAIDGWFSHDNKQQEYWNVKIYLILKCWEIIR